MPSAFERWKDTASERKAARERPFPQYSLRTMLLGMSVCAIGLGLLRRRPIHLTVEDIAFVAAIIACVVFAFVVAVVRQNRWMFVWGCVGGIIGALSCPSINISWSFPIPSFWERLSAHLSPIMVPTLLGSLIGFAIPSCLRRYDTWRRMNWTKSPEAQVRHGAMPRKIDITTREKSSEIPPDEA
jgi:hypothetical protein